MDELTSQQINVGLRNALLDQIRIQLDRAAELFEYLHWIDQKTKVKSIQTGIGKTSVILERIE